MGIKSFFIKFYEKLKNNNTLGILSLYINLIFYKIIPILILLSLIDFSNIFISILRYLIVIYLVINLLISDFILRQSIKIRNSVEIDHTCDKCSNNVVWNIQDNISNIIFYILGGFIFKYNLFLDIYWRSYIHTLPICIKNKLCIQKSIELQFASIPFGILNYVIEYGMSFVVPFEYNLILMFFVTFLIDCIVFNLNIKYQNNINVVNALLKITWNISQNLTIGYFEVKKRKFGNRDIVEEIINKLNYVKNNTWYRVLLWKEFQNLDNFISLGNTSVFYREHILNFRDLLFTIVNYLDNNTTIKIARKTKLLHLTTIFKPLMSPQHKFYIRIFESRKSIEPFIKQLLSDLETSIKNTKSEEIYEEMYNVDKKMENENVKIIEKFY
jgi:hypothetical protein